jgi:hypothetical protein
MADDPYAAFSTPADPYAAFAGKSPAPEVPQGALGAVANFARGTRMGIPFADRAVSGLEAIPHALGLGGDDYSTNLANSQAADAALRNAHSPVANFGQGAGAVASMLPLATIAPEAGAGLAARTAMGALQGGVAGGIQGASQSPDLTNLGQTLGNTASGANAGAAMGGGLPLAAGLAGKIPIQPAAKTLGDKFTRDIMGAGNVPGSNVSPSTLEAAQGTLGGGIGDVSKRNTLMLDPELHKGINAAVDSQTTPNAGVQKYADDILNRSPSMSGQDYATMRSDLSNKAYRLRQTDPDTAHAYGQMRNALDSGMDRSIDASNPTDSGVLGPLRQGYGNLQDIAQAASRPKAGTDQSVLDPRALQSALAGGGGNNPQKYAMNSGPLDAITHEAVANVQPPAQQSKLGEALARGLGAHAGQHIGAAALGGGAGFGAAGIPGALAGAAAGPFVLKGLQAGRTGLGNLGAVQGANAMLQNPNTLQLRALANALAAKQGQQYNAP